MKALVHVAGFGNGSLGPSNVSDHSKLESAREQMVLSRDCSPA